MDILSKISRYAQQRVEASRQKIPLSKMKELAETCTLPVYPLEAALAKPQMSFLCECKKASPSKGLIAPEFPYREIAQDYFLGGADAISCLTEPKWFLGSNDYLREIASAIPLPVLRKDFTVDPYMIYEARVLGASAVLLIVSILSAEQLKEYLDTAHELGLSCVVEAHDMQEIETAVQAGASIIGVNNRNLRDFTVDIRNSINLRRCVPSSVYMIAESGIRTRQDIIELEQNGISGVLIGETLMKAKDRQAMLRELKGEQI